MTIFIKGSNVSADIGPREGSLDCSGDSSPAAPRARSTRPGWLTMAKLLPLSMPSCSFVPLWWLMRSSSGLPAATFSHHVFPTEPSEVRSGMNVVALRNPTSHWLPSWSEAGRLAVDTHPPLRWPSYNVGLTHPTIHCGIISVARLLKSSRASGWIALVARQPIGYDSHKGLPVRSPCRPPRSRDSAPGEGRAPAAIPKHFPTGP